MKPMRRKDRQVTDPSEILAIIKQAKVCRLAMVDDAGLYLVPLNFGYTYQEMAQEAEQVATKGAMQEATTDPNTGLPGKLTLYFHSASSGRKIDALQSHSRVCFELDVAHALIESDCLTDYTYHYQSIIGNGTVRFVTDQAERTAAMVALFEQQAGMSAKQYHAMPRDERWMQPEAMAVFALEVEELTAKRHG